jgi:hypothetical protein
MEILLDKYLYISLAGIIIVGFILNYFLPLTYEWKGELIKKRKRLFSVGDFVFTFKTNKGKRTIVTSWHSDYRYSYDKTFTKWEIGDKFKKVKGEYLPRRVSKNS